MAREWPDSHSSQECTSGAGGEPGHDAAAAANREAPLEPRIGAPNGLPPCDTSQRRGRAQQQERSGRTSRAASGLAAWAGAWGGTYPWRPCPWPPRSLSARCRCARPFPCSPLPPAVERAIASAAGHVCPVSNSGPCRRPAELHAAVAPTPPSPRPDQARQELGRTACGPATRWATAYPPSDPPRWRQSRRCSLWPQRQSPRPPCAPPGECAGWWPPMPHWAARHPTA
eukprot:scaffold218321_cov28-Tisochrysis_lutea.AAC.2